MLRHEHAGRLDVQRTTDRADSADGTRTWNGIQQRLSSGDPRGTDQWRRAARVWPRRWGVGFSADGGARCRAPAPVRFQVRVPVAQLRSCGPGHHAAVYVDDELEYAASSVDWPRRAHGWDACGNREGAGGFVAADARVCRRAS